MAQRQPAAELRRSGSQAIDELIAAARSRGFLARIAPELQREIVESAPAIYYPKGSLSFPPENGYLVALVLQGMLRYFMSTPDGRQITIRYVGVGDLVGTLAAEGTSLNTGIQAVEPSVLLQLDRARLEAMARRRPDLTWQFLEELTTRLRFAYRALAATAFTTVRARVARDLLERARASHRLHPGLHLPVTQQGLADATGSVREVVARALRELRRDGVLARDAAGIAILDPAALVAEAGLGLTALGDASHDARRQES